MSDPFEKHPKEVCDTFINCPYCRVTELEQQLDELREAHEKLLGTWQDLIEQSDGVYGLHINGDPAPWDELLAGGRYEDWLISHSEALQGGDDPTAKEFGGSEMEALLNQRED